MSVTVSCPTWLTAAQARKEVRSLIQHQAFWGHRGGETAKYVWDEIDETNFKVKRIGPEGSHPR